MWVFAGIDGWWQAQNRDTPAAASAPGHDKGAQRQQKTETATQPPEPGKAATTTPEPAPAKQEPARPAFDIVRVEDSGEVVIAGVAPPGWTVRIETPERVIGKVKAGFDGAWVLLPDAPLPSGDHSLSVSARAPDGSETLKGAERVAVSVSADSAPAVVALSQDNRPTRILQTGRPEDVAGKPIEADKARAVAFSAVDYEDKQETGQLYLSGTAEPGARIALYLDNRFIGSTKTGVDGSWEFALTDILDTRAHALRADHVDLDSGDVLSRAEVRFDPDAAAVAGATREDTRTARNTATESVAQEQRLSKPLGADVAARANSPSAGPIETEDAATQAIVVKRGDTLWHIAEEHYGSGVRYTKIFRNNRDQIRNPHRIYPGQHFELPR